MSGNRYIKFDKKNLRVLGAAISIIAALFFVFKIMLILEDRNNTVPVDPTDYDQRDTDYEREDREMVYYNGSWYVRRNDIQTLLLIGIDKDKDFAEQEKGYRNNQQADFLVLIVFDDTAREVNAIQIDRDTMTRIDTVNDFGTSTGPVMAQIALSHTYGVSGEESCKNTANAVSGVLYDTPVDHYISYTLDVVPVVNDYYGGVTVHLDEDFTDLNPDMIQGTDYHLMGEDTVSYVRARMTVGDGLNTSRMRRHRQYIDGLLERIRDPENRGKDPLELFGQLSEFIVTDCTVNQMSDIKNKIDQYALGDILLLDGRAVEGDKFMEFYPDEEALQDLVIDTFFEKEKSN